MSDLIAIAIAALPAAATWGLVRLLAHRDGRDG
jgi:hypothetical protein